MAKQTFTTGQVLTAAQVNSLQTNDFNQTVSAKTASYVLVAADKVLVSNSIHQDPSPVRLILEFSMLEILSSSKIAALELSLLRLVRRQ